MHISHLQLQFQVSAFTEGWQRRKFQFPTILYPKTAKKAQITVFVPNKWNIQFFTISLQTFHQFWWNFAWWHILHILSITVVQKVKLKKIQDGGRCRSKKLSNAISQQMFHWFRWNLLPRCILATATSIPGQCIHRGITTQKVSISDYSLP